MITLCKECRGTGQLGYNGYHKEDIYCHKCSQHGILWDGKAIPEGFAPLPTDTKLIRMYDEQVRTIVIGSTKSVVLELAALITQRLNQLYKVKQLNAQINSRYRFNKGLVKPDISDYDNEY